MWWAIGIGAWIAYGWAVFAAFTWERGSFKVRELLWLIPFGIGGSVVGVLCLIGYLRTAFHDGLGNRVIWQRKPDSGAGEKE